MRQFSDYFDECFIDLKPDTAPLDTLFENDTEYLLIAGDFFGIQKFIFEQLSTKNAAKVLRAKSAFIQIFTRYLAEFICHKLAIEEKYILSTNAGKFEILSPNTDSAALDEVQKKVDNYFINKFYGLSGVSICGVGCQKDDFDSSRKYRNLREKIINELERKKFNKLDLVSRNDFLMDYDSDINNENLCRICNIRKGKNNCELCNGFIKLSELLVRKEKSKLHSSEMGISLDGFDSVVVIDKKIKSYVLKEAKDVPASFETIAKNSCSHLDTGIKSLAVLKADVDSMGKFMQDSDITDSFENFDIFSKTLDNFFSLHVPKLMREKYKNSYTVFAGGDDLFLLGAWDEILGLARQIQKDFQRFIKGKLSISFGIAIVKPSYPISRLANYTQELLEDAKAVDEEKNAITLFDETVKWVSYLKVFGNLATTFELLKDKENTAFLYRLLELVEMSKKVREGDVLATIWKSKLRYSWSRNMGKEDPRILEVLDKNMQDYPSETKMFLSEYIYKRRQG